jgi:hypothetical protein
MAAGAGAAAAIGVIVGRSVIYFTGKFFLYGSFTGKKSRRQKALIAWQQLCTQLRMAYAV